MRTLLREGLMMSRTKIALLVAPGAVLLIAACSTASPAKTTTSTTHAATGAQQPAVATTTTDPCQLVTPPEASALTGASYGPGAERAIGPGKTCVYGSATKNVFMVDVFQAASSGDLQQLRDHLVAEITQGGQMTPTPVSGLGDDATAYHVTSDIFNGASIFVLKGTSAIYLVDEVTGGQAPTTAALTASARTAVSRLP
jgi:Protein of unknown function (DUF3558)